jgi:nicotinamide phosphoribosyltransferase
MQPLILNAIPRSDSYKVGHYPMYLPGTDGTEGNGVPRLGGRFPFNVIFGNQFRVMSSFEGVAVTQDDIDEAAFLLGDHFSNPDVFNAAGWQYIVDEHGGRLPLEILAVPEGTLMDSGNTAIQIKTTDENANWLGQYVEGKLLHLWDGSSVATLSRYTKMMMERHLRATGSSLDGLDFMLHDFGYRGNKNDEAAALDGLAHLISFKGTDTLPALWLARQFYGATGAVGYSVFATEHSVMTSTGNDIEMFDYLLTKHEFRGRLISVVIDSYNPYEFVEAVCARREQILAFTGGTGKLVLRPDSPTDQHPTAGGQMAWIADRLYQTFGGTVTSTGHKVLDGHVGVLWGDGIDYDGIDQSLTEVADAGFAAQDFVYGQGGALHTSGVRDTQRWALKCSAQLRDGVWHKVAKNPLDQTKKQQAGRLKVVVEDGAYRTVDIDAPGDNILVPIFRNGDVLNKVTFDEVRATCDRTAEMWLERNAG